MAHDRGVHQPVLGILLVPVEDEIKTASEETGVKTEVKLLGGLPGHVRIRELVGIGTIARLVGKAVGKTVSAVIRTYLDGGKILEIINRTVTVLAPASTYLEEIEGVAESCHPRLVGHHPAGGNRRERTPAVSRSEIG